MNTRSAQASQPRLLGIFAHPDDETFCAGGTLAKYVAAGGEAMVVSATRGQTGQIRDAKAATRRTLGQVREHELRRACEHLGVQHVRCLDYLDGAVQETDQERLQADIASIIRGFRPDVVITFGPDGAYGHPDHIAISTATTAAYSLAADQLPYGRGRLYHSHFPRSRLLLVDELARWLAAMKTRFRGTVDYVHALSLFAQESTMLRYASGHVTYNWFPPGFYIVEQGEPATSLYLVISGQADVIQEAADGTLQTLARLGPGEFFGELGVAHRQPRNAHVVAVDGVTCLVFSATEPSAFAGRGAEARLSGITPTDLAHSGAPGSTTTCIDVSAFVEQKIAAIAAHHTQYPIDPKMFPRSMLQELLGREYFVRIYPPIELETDLFS